jgi:hypothetical protein
MAEGGLASLPVPDYMFDEQTFAGGGIVAFAKGDEVSARERAKQKAEAYLGESISDEDFNMLLKATYGESSIKLNLAENAMIMGSMLNRARTSGKSIPEVLNAPNQFESVTGKKGNRVPNERFVQGPSEKRAAGIFNAMDALPRVPREQEGFTSADPRAYKPGTNINYLTEMKKSPNSTRYGDSQFFNMLMAPQTQIARNEPTAAQIAQSVLPGTPSAQATTPQTQMARNEPPAPTAYDLVRSMLPGISSAAAPTLGPSRADRALSALNAINPIGTAQAGELPKPQGAGNRENYIPTEDALIPRAGRAIKRGFNAVAGDLNAAAQNMAAAELNEAAMGANIGPTLFGGQLTPYRSPTTPPSMEREPKPFTGKPSLLPDGRPYTGPYNFGGKNGTKAAPSRAPTSAPAAPVMAAAPAKETAEEAMARILAAQKKENFWNMISQAGFGMMAGTSPNALTNIGAGFASALPGLSTANKADRELALKQEEMAQRRDMNEKQLAAQTPTTMQYANSQVALFKSKNPRATADQIEEVRSKALVDYPVSIQKTTGQMTANQANVLAQNAATLGNIPKGPDGKRMTQDQYAQQLMLQYGSGGLGGANLGIQDYTSFFSG